MKTDAAFCSTGGGQVRRIMEKRRAHGECGSEKGGCEVVLGGSCGGRKGWRKESVVGRFGRRVGRMGGIKTSLVMWVVGLLVTSLAVNFWFAIKWYVLIK